MGLLLEANNTYNPDDTVTKKAPNTTTKTPNNNLLKTLSPGIMGINAMSSIKAMLPNNTTLKLKSLSVRATVLAVTLSFSEPRLSLNEEMIVGMVFNNVMKPPRQQQHLPLPAVCKRGTWHLLYRQTGV